ncbi:MAG: deoxyribodipyrimidine photo-lyase [Acidobacteriota bacterium]
MVALERVRLLSDESARAEAHYVLYWALINRRLDSNHALAFAVEQANKLRLPVLVYEGLTCAHRWANTRFHQFIREGVEDNAKQAKELGLGYLFYDRARREDRDDALYRLSEHAALLVTDDYPGYLARHYNATVPAKIGVPYYVVDASCIVPMGCFSKQEYAAYTFRPKVQRLLDDHMHPVETKVDFRWQGTLPILPNTSESEEIDTAVPASAKFRGGRKAALARLDGFLENGLRHYAKSNREPLAQATSQLSPYLHFGHISALEIALAVRDYAAEHKLIVPEFLEQLIVRRELAFNFASRGPDPRTLAALPAWAQATLAKHDGDAREWVYSREQFELADTHDELWNATQRELLRDGIIHGYHRMYWGKKIIEWSASHQEALDTMIYLNDRYALDGRDPNTYANILWCFGLHDRPWTERPIFGMIRYMNLAGMQRKTHVQAYIEAQR